jgi:hypothetical protein
MDIIAGYVGKALHHFCDTSVACIQNSPHVWIQPHYGVHHKVIPHPDNTKTLDTSSIKRVQDISGVRPSRLLYHAGCPWHTHLTIIKQHTGNIEGNHCSTMQHPTLKPQYDTLSVMCIYTYTVMPRIYLKHRHTAALGTFFLGNHPINTSATPPPTSCCHHHHHTMGMYTQSAASCRTSALFHNAHDDIPLRTVLVEMGHPQAETPIQTDKACAAGITNQTVKQR